MDVQRQLANDLKAVLKEAEALIDSTPPTAGGTIEAARERLGRSLQSVRGQWNRLEDKTARAADTARRVVREHPYETMSAGLLAAAFVAGAFWMWRQFR